MVKKKTAGAPIPTQTLLEEFAAPEIQQTANANVAEAPAAVIPAPGEIIVAKAETVEQPKANKSEIIRKHLEKYPNKTANEIADMVSALGMVGDVKVGLVYAVKANMQKKASGNSVAVAPKPATVTASDNGNRSVATAGSDVVIAIKEIRSLIARFGSPEAVKEAIDLLA